MSDCTAILDFKLKIYAHTLPGQSQSAWETLDAHAANVARKGRDFVAAFGRRERSD